MFNILNYVGWLVPVEEAPEWSITCSSQGAWCKVCKVGLQCQKKDLKKHSQTEKHKSNMSSLKQTNTICNYGTYK